MLKKKIGIIGGMGSRAGAFLLKRIIDHSPAETDQDFPEIIFHNNSQIPDRTRAIIYNERSPLNDILQSVELFNRNGVEVIIMGCITAYYYYDRITTQTHARVLNPLQIVAEYLDRKYPGGKRIGVLATTGTIKTGLFNKWLDSDNTVIVTLDRKNQEELFMRAVYMKNGFKSAVISEEAKALMDRCVEIIKQANVDLIIGGCTEVSLAIEPGSLSVPYIDTLDLLAKKTVDYCYDLSIIHT